jgi:signal transduction histidine kinase
VLGVVARALGRAARGCRGPIENGSVRIDVRDDRVGGARPDGTGLLGLRDGVVTLGGCLELDSPPGGGTRIAVRLPLRRS